MGDVGVCGVLGPLPHGCQGMAVCLSLIRPSVVMNLLLPLEVKHVDEMVRWGPPRQSWLKAFAVGEPPGATFLLVSLCAMSVSQRGYLPIR